MKKLIVVIALVALVFLFQNTANASMAQDVGDIVFETTGWIVEKDGIIYSFVADVEPFTYLVTLSDLSQKPSFGFQDLFLSITTATDQIDFLTGSGSFTFEAVPGETYFVNVFGVGAGNFEAGLFGVEIQAVPIPAAVLLFGSGLLGLVLVRRRKH